MSGIVHGLESVHRISHVNVLVMLPMIVESITFNSDVKPFWKSLPIYHTEFRKILRLAKYIETTESSNWNRILSVYTGASEVFENIDHDIPIVLIFGFCGQAEWKFFLNSSDISE